MSTRPPSGWTWRRSASLPTGLSRLTTSSPAPPTSGGGRRTTCVSTPPSRWRTSSTCGSNERLPAPSATTDDRLWFKRAVFYEVLVRGFADSNDDGVGDFPGLVQHLDHLRWLGVDCIWLLPFNDSPLRDGGYDVRDHYSVLPGYGNVDDVRGLVARAQHWACGWSSTSSSTTPPTSIPGSSRRGQSTELPVPRLLRVVRYRRVATQMRASSSSTRRHPTGPGTGRPAYYWHRFFSHQPDLNYDNPEVREAVLKVMRFWLDGAWTASALTPSLPL